MHFIKAQGPRIGTVILAHGMYSNYRTCRGLARFLAGSNFDCWLLDSQGHGYSDPPLAAPDFETMSLNDTAQALDTVLGCADGPVWWVGHSGGGLAILMHLARYPEQQAKIGGIVLLASQAFGAGYNWRRRLCFALYRLPLYLIKRVPGKALGLGPENEFSPVMNQWLGWTVSRSWLGSDGFDYKGAMGVLQLPVLAMAGAGDRFIAPVSGCRELFDSLGTLEKTFIHCGVESGHAEDFTHARLVSSRGAAADVWPVVRDWLRARSEYV